LARSTIYLGLTDVRNNVTPYQGISAKRAEGERRRYWKIPRSCGACDAWRPPAAPPYGVYDLTNNVGWVSVGTEHDTASVALNAIGRWWTTMGKGRTPKPHA
jgi:Rhodopirellula transposase DDE domain